nr:high-affinity choline transporter 1-like isoform X1 [Dermacentor andersoni]
MTLNWAAAFVAILYYLTVIFVGVWAGRKVHHRDLPERRRRSVNKQGTRTPPQLSLTAGDQYVRNLLVANRSLPLVLSCGSMTATWVGGGYLNATAEAVFKHGLLHTYAPFGYTISLLLGGLLFAGRMRLTDAVTMLDPFQKHYGRWMGLLLALPAVGSEVLWSGAILSCLEGTAAAVNGVRNEFFVFFSAVVTLMYTSLGGIYSVAYTDILQLSMCILGMFVCLPFCLRQNFSGQVGPPHDDWLGSLPSEELGQTIDVILMTALGGIPWQVYFQQVASAQSPYNAKVLSFVGALGSFALTLPPVIIAGSARGTNFTRIGYNGTFNLEPEDRDSVLPLALYYMSPVWMSMAGLLGITAAVMSSVDSSMLAASTLITHNLYRTLVRPRASELEISAVFRFMVWTLGAAAVNVSFYVTSVFRTWTLCSDMAYVLLFPQLLCVFYFKKATNAYGAVAAFVFGFVLRVLCGESSARIPVILRFPNYDEVAGQRFPFRTFCMATSVAVLLVVSRLAATAFRQALLSPASDVFRCFQARLDADDSRLAALTDQDKVSETAGAASPFAAATPTGRGKQRKKSQSRPVTPTTASPPPETIASPRDVQPSPSGVAAQRSLDSGKTQPEPAGRMAVGPASTRGPASSGAAPESSRDFQEERQPATPPGDDVSGARTPKQSSPKGSPSSKHPYSLRAGATPTRLGGAMPSRDTAAARAAKTPPEVAGKGSSASTTAARASGTASPNYPSSTTRPKGAPRAVTTTATKSPSKGVSTSQLLRRTFSHESTSLRR